ncbi:MAG: DUF6065 family protein [Acidobacteriaceae bacterium]|nr:DUF6065 family protein [Acidobacteriaceae bacterium]
MDLICHLVDSNPVDIRPARRRRHWMDQTPDAYAYRCLPLSIANTHGWEIFCPVAFEAEWNGGDGKDDIRVVFDGDDRAFGNRKLESMVASHFGCGILSFDLGLMITTSPGYDLWVTGPVNEFKDGIQALSAVIETSWMPFTFAMSWKFTRPNLKIRFEKDEPFCFFFPIEHGLVERCDPAFKPFDEGSDLERQYHSGRTQRAFLDIVKKMKGDELSPEARRDLERMKFQGWYRRGEMPDGTVGGRDHKTVVQPKSFERAPDKNTQPE